MTSSIAFVGAGPTTIYTLHALVCHAIRPFALTIFEEQASAGLGTPYRPGWNDPAMLANIASIEIPPLRETLVGWLSRQPDDRLAEIGIGRDEIDDRAFYPRLALGEFFLDQFHALIERAKAKGITVEIRARCRVLDAVAEADGMRLSIQPQRGVAIEERFDYVVLATGHQWPAEPEVRPGYFLSPWPASALSTIPATEIGIRGSSLTAIDTAVALAGSHGEFAETNDGTLAYNPEPGTADFHMTMMSRKGLLPEADFFHPVPYEPLTICTAAAIEDLVATSDGDLLEQAFSLFKLELAKADPDYAGSIALSELALEDFCEAYFADRVAADPFEWAGLNLAEAQQNYETETTVPWRYAILRMHEVIALLVPHLTPREFRRFSKSFKPIFVDDYATVPHTSIQRMVALHRAGKLDVIAVGDEYRLDSHRAEGGVVLYLDGKQRSFPAFIDATGQRPLGAKDFPFPSLRKQGLVQDAAKGEADNAARGILIDDEFHPVSEEISADRLFCLSLPFILGRHPFIQGITSSHEMGSVVGDELARIINGNADRSPSYASGQEAAA